MFFLGRLAASGLNMNTLQADIIGLLSGTITNVSSLSANFVSASSRMNTTVAGGWTVADAAAGSVAFGVTPKVITSPWSDDAAKFKCVRLSSDVNTTSFSLQGYESWNSTTHTGLNPHTPQSLTAATWQTITPVVDSWLVISSSGNHIFVAQMASATNYSVTQHYFASEYSRDDDWNTVTLGYPAWFSSGATASTAQAGSTVQNAGISRLPVMTVAPIVDATSVLSNTTGNSGTNRFKIVPANPVISTDGNGAGLESMGNFITSTFSMDASKNLSYQLLPLKLAPWSTTSASLGNHSFGSINAKTPFLYVFKNIWGGGDEVDIAGVRYFYFFVGGSIPMLLKEQ
jgi:hypothetical protein